MTDDRRLIEDYIPIQAISLESSREKNVRRGHISNLHLWWARRPLVACRAAVYSALVPAPASSGDAAGAEAREKASEFMRRLCVYPGSDRDIERARQQILTAHAERLSQEEGKPVTPADLEAGRTPLPRVLDMFAGGGAIPLEALRLGCDTYALDLNPVAHIVELCTLVYPQKFGMPDPAATGCAPDGTWAGLAEEVRYWGECVLQRAWAEIGDLYPAVPDPSTASQQRAAATTLPMEAGVSPTGPRSAYGRPGWLTPVAYLWTRTAICVNPACRATIPLARQGWLCKKEDRYVALRAVALASAKRVRFEVVESSTTAGLGFEPEGEAHGGNVVCPFCQSVSGIGYLKSEGWAGRLAYQPVALICAGARQAGKAYLSAETSRAAIPDETHLEERLHQMCARSGLTVPAESIAGLPPESRENTLGTRVRPYGLRGWGDLFTCRQRLCLLTFAMAVRAAHHEMTRRGYSTESSTAVATMLACVLDKQADFNSTLARLKPDGGRGIVGTFGRQSLPMVWDFAEANPFNEDSACWQGSLRDVAANISDLAHMPKAACVARGSAASVPWSDAYFDAIITDPPYYDNVPYADISDFFYVWLKRAIGDLYPEHFASEGTPKRAEATADPARHNGSRDRARQSYEQIMARSFSEASRVLKDGGILVVVYAHKTTLGWATLVDALRAAGFIVTEAWPLDTETSGRLRAQNSSALASSIFLVARKRSGPPVGSYDEDVRSQLESVVRERVTTLWDQGVSGADLVIACVGAGLQAFTRFARVVYANGEEVPASRFLAEVETVVLETILARLSREVGADSSRHNLAGVDPATRFYLLWRYTYHSANLDPGEAIIFANGTHVELDGPAGLSSGPRPLLEKSRGSYRLRDFTERGGDEKLGLPSEGGRSAPLIDALHRFLWLVEHRPLLLPEFLRQAQPDLEQLRLVTQALAGPALKGGELAAFPATPELSALTRLSANWSSILQSAGALPTPAAPGPQQRLTFGE